MQECLCHESSVAAKAEGNEKKLFALALAEGFVEEDCGSGGGV
jgi:hypothetical protein